MKIISCITLAAMTIPQCYGMFGAAPQQQAPLSYNQINLRPSGNMLYTQNVYIDASALGGLEGNAPIVNFGFNEQPFSSVSAPMAYNSSMIQGGYFCLPSMQNDQIMQPMMQNIGPQTYQQMMQPMVQQITPQMMQTTMPNMVPQIDQRNDQMTQPLWSPFEMHETYTPEQLQQSDDSMQPSSLTYQEMRESSHETAEESGAASDNQVPPEIRTITKKLNSMRSRHKLTQLEQKDRDTLLHYMCDSSANSKKVERMLQDISVRTLYRSKAEHRKRCGMQVRKSSSIYPGLPEQVAEVREKTKSAYAIALAIRPGEEDSHSPFCQAVVLIVRKIRLQNEGASAQPGDFRKQRIKGSTLATETKKAISRLYQGGERCPIPIIEKLKLCEGKDDWGPDIIAVAKYLTELGNEKTSTESKESPDSASYSETRRHGLKPKRAPRKRYERLNLTAKQMQEIKRLCAENYSAQEIAIRLGLIQAGEKCVDKSWYGAFRRHCHKHKKAIQKAKRVNHHTLSAR